MNRRSPSANIRSAAWMALLSAVLAFVAVSVGEASADPRRGGGLTLRTSAAAIADPAPERPASTGKTVRVVYPAVVVAR
jgi:hypothetical protein